MPRQPITSNLTADRPGGRWKRIAGAAALCLLAVGVPAWSQAVDDDDPVVRSMAFVERTIEATELLNNGQVEEALTAFQELEALYGDLDEDGFVALATGDCLSKLGRPDEAWAIYESAAAEHPELASRIDERLTELELSGTVTDALLDELRIAAKAADDNRFAAAWYLARGLQKRAHDLLNETLDAFTQASAPGSPVRGRTVRPFYTAHLEELVLQLGSLIEQLESRWSKLGRRWSKLGRSMRDCASEEDDYRADATTMESWRGEWAVQQPDGGRIAFQVRLDKTDGCIQVTADGKPVPLTAVPTALIRQHQDRINAILIEALATQSSQKERR